MGGRCCCCGCTNAVLALLNVATTVISLVLVASALWLTVQPANACDRFLEAPLLLSGAFLFVVSLLGLVGSCGRVSCMLWLYLAVMFLLIVGLACFTVLAFLLTNKAAAEVVSDRGYGDYRLGNYSTWLPSMVYDDKNWMNVQSCLKEAMVCGGVKGVLPVDPNVFYRMKLSPIQSGCCKPPTACGFKFVNGTHRAAPARGVLSREGDCRAWKDDPQRLCFDCGSCKAGVLVNLQQQWRTLALFNLALLFVLVVIYAVGCCAIRSTRRDSYHRYRTAYRP